MVHDSSERVRIEGGCHCKAVRFEADVKRVAEILDCNCSICSMMGFRHLIVPHGDFRLLRGEDKLIRYRFGTGAADHLFCGACGVKSFYQPRSHPEAWSVNLNALDDPAALKIAARPFDGRHWESAKAALDRCRRATNSKNHRSPDSLVLRQRETHNGIHSSKPRLRGR